MKRVYATKQYDMTVRSAILTSEKPGKGFEVIAAENQHQLNKLIGHLPSGEKIIVGLRPGKGGMDFNKVAGGKIYAVAVDGFSPVYEKDGEGKPDYNKQKTENGLPYYTGSGLYMLSSKEYPALMIQEVYGNLVNQGTHLQMVTQAQLEAFTEYTVAEDMDIDFLHLEIQMALSLPPLVAAFDEEINKRRKRGISRAKEEAEDNGSTYDGVEFSELKASPRDGSNILLLAVKSGEEVKEFVISREVEEKVDGVTQLRYVDDEALYEYILNSPVMLELKELVSSGKTAQVRAVNGYLMRTSVAFRRKIENYRASGASSENATRYGDAVYIYGALKGWTKSLIAVMHSMHPYFPTKDYEAHHYVVAPRQAEIGMQKAAAAPAGSIKQTPAAPQSLNYKLGQQLFKGDFV